MLTKNAMVVLYGAAGSETVSASNSTFMKNAAAHKRVLSPSLAFGQSCSSPLEIKPVRVSLSLLS